MTQTTYQLVRNVNRLHVLPEDTNTFSSSFHKETPTVLLISRSDESRSFLKSQLTPHGLTVIENDRADTNLIGEDVSVVLLDVPVFATETIAFCRKLKAQHPSLAVIVLEPPGGDEDYRLEIMRHALFRFAKPCDPYYIVSSMLSAVHTQTLLKENQKTLEILSPPKPESVVFPQHSTAGQILGRQVHAFGKLGGCVLISGDRGTGKNVAAWTIFQESSRADRCFCHLACDAVPNEMLDAQLWGVVRDGQTSRNGQFEFFDGGTIFLDRIEALSPISQRKLLHYLRTKSYRPLGGPEAKLVDIRIIASTRIPPILAYAQELLEEELFHFLTSVSLHLPPLRERVEDIEEFANCILTRLKQFFPVREIGLSNSALRKLCQHAWPGNLTELESVLFRAIEASRDGVIEDSHIVFKYDSGGEARSLAGLTREELDYLSLTETLAACKGNRKLTAKKLGVSEKTIYNLLNRFEKRMKRDGASK